MQRIHDMVKQISATDGTISHRKSGTGKRWWRGPVHADSLRRQTVRRRQLRAIPESLIERLFGHKKGFTARSRQGGYQGRRRWNAVARRISEMPVHLQVKLPAIEQKRSCPWGCRCPSQSMYASSPPRTAIWPRRSIRGFREDLLPAHIVEIRLPSLPRGRDDYRWSLLTSMRWRWEDAAGFDPDVMRLLIQHRWRRGRGWRTSSNGRSSCEGRSVSLADLPGVSELSVDTTRLRGKRSGRERPRTRLHRHVLNKNGFSTKKTAKYSKISLPHSTAAKEAGTSGEAREQFHS